MTAIVLISGPSCSGKTTLAKALQDKYGFKSLVTTTTRPMRQGETQGHSYNFISHDEFDTLQAKGGLIEQNQHGQNFYGIGKEELWHAIKNEGNKVSIVVDPNGARKMRNYLVANTIPHLSVFIDTPIKTCVDRMVARLISNSLSNSEFSSRVKNMIEIESGWLKIAHTANYYDMILSGADEVDAKFINSHLDKLLKVA